MKLLTPYEVRAAVSRARDSLNESLWDDDVIDTKARALVTEFADKLIEELDA